MADFYRSCQFARQMISVLRNKFQEHENNGENRFSTGDTVDYLEPIRQLLQKLYNNSHFAMDTEGWSILMQSMFSYVGHLFFNEFN